MGAPIFHSLEASEFFFRILYFLLWIRVAFFPSRSPVVAVPIIPVFNEPELSQTCALLLYSSYSMSCLEGVINDTMNPCLMHLYEALSQTRTDAYTAIANAMRDFNPSVMSAQQIIDYFTPKLGKVPLPPSMKRPNDFMASIHDTGLILELLVVDWRTLREAMRNPSEQVLRLLTSVIDTLRSMYTENPEYKYTSRLIGILSQHDVAVTMPNRKYCQACVVAANLMCSCLSIGFLQYYVWVPSSEPVQLIMLLRTYIHSIAPNMSEVGFKAFDSEINSIFTEMQTDMNWVICSPAYARQNPLLLKQALNRAFLGLKELLQDTPVFKPFQALLDEGLHMMDNAVPATREYVGSNLHPAPRDVAEAQDLYDMVVNEKACFIGQPTLLMLYRWAKNLGMVVKMLTASKLTGTALHGDACNLCNVVLDQIQAMSKPQ